MKCEDFLSTAVVTYGKMKNSEAIRKIYRLIVPVVVNGVNIIILVKLIKHLFHI